MLSQVTNIIAKSNYVIIVTYRYTFYLSQYGFFESKYAKKKQEALSNNPEPPGVSQTTNGVES